MDANKLLTIVIGLGVALGLWLADAVEHDLLPRLPGGRPEEHQQRLEEGLEVVVPVDGGPLLQGDLAEHLTQAQHQYYLALTQKFVVWRPKKTRAYANTSVCNARMKFRFCRIRSRPGWSQI